MWYSTRLIVLSVVVATVLGCTKRTQPPGPPATAFDPKLVLNWPATPEESRQVLPDEGGDLKIYSATLTDKRADGFIIFIANVQEHPAKAFQGQSPRAMLDATVFASQKEETNRKEIEHGLKKHPGLDISTQSVTGSGKPLIGRRLVVMAGPRIYDLGVSGTVEGLMQLPEVKAFFESFDIRD